MAQNSTLLVIDAGQVSVDHGVVRAQVQGSKISRHSPKEKKKHKYASVFDKTNNTSRTTQALKQLKLNRHYRTL